MDDYAAHAELVTAAKEHVNTLREGLCLALELLILRESVLGLVQKGVVETNGGSEYTASQRESLQTPQEGVDASIMEVASMSKLLQRTLQEYYTSLGVEEEEALSKIKQYIRSNVDYYLEDVEEGSQAYTCMKTLIE